MALAILTQLEAGIAGQPLAIRSWEKAATDVLAQYEILLSRPI
jgi:hypothetical protein